MVGHSETRQRVTRVGWILGLILLIASACGEDESTGAKREPAAQSPDAAASPTPAEIVSFTSSHYGYSIRYPSTAEPTEATRSLGAFEPPLPGTPGVDTLRTPEGIINVAAQRVRERLTLDDWTASIEKLIRGAGIPTCAKPASRERTDVGGRPAQLLVYPTCDGNYGLWVMAIDNKDAFIIWWLSDPGSEEEDRTLFERALENFRFSS